jgi:hypothetical protein
MPEERSIGCVVLSMPDYVADSVAHTMAKISQVARLIPDGQGCLLIGPIEHALAEGLAAAARAAGYRCPSNRVALPDENSGRAAERSERV